MGTHPIFESDFDCLTVFERIKHFWKNHTDQTRRYEPDHSRRVPTQTCPLCRAIEAAPVSALVYNARDWRVDDGGVGGVGTRVNRRRTVRYEENHRFGQLRRFYCTFIRR